MIAQQIFDNLVDIQSGVSGVVPDLAESWDTSTDGLSYTFHLRPAKFSNGDPVTAEDVKFSLDEAADPNVDGGYAFLYPIKDVVIVDQTTVRVDLKNADLSFIDDLAIGGAMILPEKIVQSLGQDKFGESPIGSGPFMLKSWTRGQSVELVRNPYYWKTGQPYLDGVTFVYVVDDNARALQVESGQADVADPVTVAQIGSLKSTAGVTVETNKLETVQDVVLNQKNKGPLQDPKVRQALNYATDKQAICDTVFQGTAVPANSPLQQGTNFWDSSVAPIPYDLQQAKNLMAQSSVPNGFTMSLVYSAGNAQRDAEALILQSEWAQIGVKLTLQVVDPAVLSQAEIDGTYDAYFEKPTAWSSDSLDTSEIASLMFIPADGWAAGNAFWNDPTAIQLATTAAATNDVAKARDLYSQLQKYALANGPFVPLVFADLLTALRNPVHGFATNPLAWWNLEDVWMAK
jgi:peptide/nickel transport system substrate-binding protein